MVCNAYFIKTVSKILTWLFNKQRYVIQQLYPDKAFTSLKESALKSKFKSEELIEVATPLFNLKEGNAETINAEVERIADMKVFKTIQGSIAGGMHYIPGSNDNKDVSTNDTMEA